MTVPDIIYNLGLGAIFCALLHPTAHLKGDAFMTKPKLKPVPVGPTTEDKIRVILSDLLSVDIADITPLSKIQEDLGADSLDVVEFIMILEDTFAIVIPDEKAEKVLTVADAVKLVDRILAMSSTMPVESVEV